MPTGDKFLSVLAMVLIVLAFVLESVIPQTYRFGLGGRYNLPDSIAFWVFLVAGLGVGMVVLLKIVVRELSLRGHGTTVPDTILQPASSTSLSMN